MQSFLKKNMVDYFFHNIQERQIVIRSRPLLLFYLSARPLIKVGFYSKMYGTRMLLFSLMRL